MSGDFLEKNIDFERWLDEAEFGYLVDGKTDFEFPVRRRSGDDHFYERLDRELRSQNAFQIRSFRSVKEGFTKISRPAVLGLSLDELFSARPHLRLIRGEVERLTRDFGALDVSGFLRKTGREALDSLATVRSCCEVLIYLIENQAEAFGLMPRQIPHGQSTKLIGKEALLLRLFAHWQGEPSKWADFIARFGLVDKPLEYRFFAPRCRVQGQELKEFHGLLAKEWRESVDFAGLAGTLIVENFVSFYAVTKESKNSLIVWGEGWKAAHLRSLLESLPRPVYYWGDMDREGYEIFGFLKSYDPDLGPVLMARADIDRYAPIQQRKDIYLGPFRIVPDLQEEYEWVARRGIQIEQEQMRETWPFGTALS